jgi:hypothetical protein
LIISLINFPAREIRPIKTDKKHYLFVFLAFALCLAFSNVQADGAPADTEPQNQVPADPNNAVAAPADPNDLSDNDAFNLKASTLVLIRQAYARIMAPDLVTDEGFVDYATLRRKRSDVLTATIELESLNPALLMSLSKEERIAFWINTYNFCMLKLIIDHYPIEPRWYMILYPNNSIMQIPGAWTKIYFDIQKLEYNLKEIEQNFLLDRYKDPRICFALSYASIGGATLRNEPYTGEQLDSQLDDQVKRYLQSPKGMKLDKENRVLYLSNIFQMHKSVFLNSEYAAVLKFRTRKPEERAWLNFILPYMDETDAAWLEKNNFEIKFLQYDWLLNEKP